MLERLMGTCFWPSIILSLGGGAASAIWIGWSAIVVAITAPMAVLMIWVAAHFFFVPPAKEDLGLKLFAEAQHTGEESA